MEHLTQQGLRRVNLTDEDAQLMKGRQGIMPAYNAQTMVSPLSDYHRTPISIQSGVGGSSSGIGKWDADHGG